jgi:hypothetical protein
MDSQYSAADVGNALELYHIYILENMYDISILNRLKLLNVKHAKYANRRSMKQLEHDRTCLDMDMTAEFKANRGNVQWYI